MGNGVLPAGDRRMVRSFSVIVPVLNKQNEIIRTLNSIEASIAYFYRHHSASDAATAEVVIVDEGSSDRTVELVTEFSQNKPHYRLIQHFKSLGAGPARNTGVRVSKGEILFFCDGDDLFFEPHIAVCLHVLSHHSSAEQTHSPRSIQLDTDSGSQTIVLPEYPVAAIRTGVHMRDAIHPYWKLAIENTLPQNLCVRRECHEFIEGFPENSVYRLVGCEDIAYTVCLSKFFKVFKVDLETVEYIRYPGNNFDRQLKKFQTPPEQYQDNTPARDKEFHAIRMKLEQEKQSYLLEKLRKTDKNSEFFTLLNWQQLGRDYLEQGCYPEAISLWQQGIETEPEATEGVKNLLAAACNNVGSILRKQGNLDQAAQSFKTALNLNPSFSAADLAKVYYNLATTLRDQGHGEEALQSLNQSRQLDPTISETLPEFSKVHYQLQILAKGYQFSHTNLSEYISIWEQQLQRFVAIPDVRVLSIGDGEGASTCWFLDNLLIHESAQINCIHWVDHGTNKAAIAPNQEQFDANLAKTGCAQKARIMTGKPQIILRSLVTHAYYLVYFGDFPGASDVLEILVLSWGLLRVGGILILDNYGLNTSRKNTEGVVKAAIDAFISVFNQKIKLLHQDRQILIEKIAE
jgi:glycosyltransferase involved in cell wall biosynthesis